MQNKPDEAEQPKNHRKDKVNAETYGEFVAALVKPGEHIKNEITPDEANMLHLSVGISGESGELLDCIKKHVIYKKPLDRANAIEELGDLEFYMEGLRQAIGVTRDATIEANVSKLMLRYKRGYTNKAAQERSDKVNGDLCVCENFGEFPCPKCGG